MAINRSNISLRNNTTAGYNNVTDADGISETQWNSSVLEIAESIVDLDRGIISYADIAARDADQTNVDVGRMVEVLDASADATVASGRAYYRRTGSGWNKISASEGFRENLGALALLSTVNLANLASEVRVELSPDVINFVNITINTASENAAIAFGSGTSAGDAKAIITLNENAGQFQVSQMFAYRHYYVEVIQGATAGRTFTGWAAGGGNMFTFSGDIGTNLLNTPIGAITKYRLWLDNQNVVHVERLDENEVDNGINGLTIQTGAVAIPFLNSIKFRRYSLSLGENITVSFSDASFRTSWKIFVTVTGAARNIIWPSTVLMPTNTSNIMGVTWVTASKTLTLPVGQFEIAGDFDGTSDFVKVTDVYE